MRFVGTLPTNTPVRSNVLIAGSPVTVLILSPSSLGKSGSAYALLPHKGE